MSILVRTANGKVLHVVNYFQPRASGFATKSPPCRKNMPPINVIEATPEDIKTLQKCPRCVAAIEEETLLDDASNWEM